MKSLFLALFFSVQAQAACVFENLSLYEIKNSTEFDISDESATRITPPLFWSNYEFFKDFRHGGCRGAWRTASVTHKATGGIYRYYRTAEDNCDGGNTNGIFVVDGRSVKAMAIMNDGDIRCAP